ncbi:hypothetical protein scyTo_0023737, partial [Scyliorhinus torazame]|nr:hypothetical protein [Scyliorhinus torazame]
IVCRTKDEEVSMFENLMESSQVLEQFSHSSSQF